MNGVSINELPNLLPENPNETTYVFQVMDPLYDESNLKFLLHIHSVATYSIFRKPTVK